MFDFRRLVRWLSNSKRLADKSTHFPPDILSFIVLMGEEFWPLIQQGIHYMSVNG
jgi:hypothetical protein